MTRVRWGFLVLLVAAALVGGACGGGGDDEAGSAGADGGGNFDSTEARQADIAQEQSGFDGDPGAGGGAARSAAALPPIGPSLIKTADLTIEVADGEFGDAFQSVVDVAQRHGGFVLSSATQGEEARRGRITIRVPSRAYADAVGSIRELGENKRREERAQDVTEEFVDLEARLRHLTAQETVMLRLMDRAQTITDTIRVQNELTGIQLEIERIRGRLRYLEDQTSFSTINVVLEERGVAPADDDEGLLAQAWQVARDTTRAIVSGFLIGGAALAPVLVVLLLALLAFRWLRPRLGRVTGS